VEDVTLFVTALGRPIVGTKHNCEIPTHCAPMKPLADVLTGMVNNYVIWACRSGSKTYQYGGLDTWYKSIRYPYYTTSILGGSEAQSQKSAEAMADFFRIAGNERDVLKRPQGRERVEFANGSLVSILPASPKSARGPHTVSLKLDEVDEIDRGVYEDAISIPQSNSENYPKVTGMFSTNHRYNGLMDDVITTASNDLNTTAVYRYCILECLESCETAGLSCSTCYLSAFCPGPQMKTADGYYKHSDFQSTMEKLSLDMLMRDWFCIKGGLGNSVYEHEWDEDVHLKPLKLLDAPITVSIDWGGVDPFVAGVYQKLPESPEWGTDAWGLVADVYMKSTDGTLHNGIFLQECQSKPWWGKITEIVADSNRPDLIQQWKDALPRSVKFLPCDKRDIDQGIESVKNVLRPVGSTPRLFVNRNLYEVRREMKQYVTRENNGVRRIVDADNHHPDQIRYFCRAKFGAVEEGYVGVIDRPLY